MTTSIPLKSCTTQWILSAFADEAGPTADDQIAALKKAGLTHIDIRSVEGFNVSELPLAKAELVHRKFQDASIKVNMLGSPIGKITIADDFQIDVKRLKHLASVGEIVECNKVRIFSYYNAKDKPASFEAWRDESIRRLKELKALAGDLGLVLYHENESAIFGDSVANVKILIDALRDHGNQAVAGKPSAFAAIFDFGNYNHGGEDVWEAWVTLRDFTDAFHLKENVKGPDGKLQHVPVGQSNIPSTRIFADALARGWSGPLSLEPHLSHSPAVLATGPGGKPNQKLSELTTAETFHVAAEAAKDVLGKLKAPIV